MTEKDYELIAGALAKARPSTAAEALARQGDMAAYAEIAKWRGVVKAVAGALEGQNSRFDKARFEDACYKREAA